MWKSKRTPDRISELKCSIYSMYLNLPPELQRSLDRRIMSKSPDTPIYQRIDDGSEPQLEFWHKLIESVMTITYM